MDWTVFIAPVLSISFVVFGWFVLWGNAKKVATRSETYSAMKEIFSELETLRNDASRLWLAKNVEAEEAKFEATRLKLHIRHIINSLEHLDKCRGVRSKDIRPFKLRTAVTLDIEKLIRAEGGLESFGHYSSIHDTIEGLKLELRKCFEVKYPPSMGGIF